MPLKTYQEAIHWLFQQFPSYQNKGASAYKPGLTNTFALCNAFGNPHSQLRFVHVAGSNGKGSVSSMISSAFTEAGYKSGLFTSPHLLHFEERIRINGLEIPQSEVLEFCQECQSLELDFTPSFFEITWVMALRHFEKNKVDICVIETGLGGRLDSTNVITPLLSVITNISLEHIEFLGDTLEKIAFEKGGIIKRNVPVVIGESQIETLPVFEDLALERNSRLVQAENQEISTPFDFPLLGEYQLSNYRTAHASIEALLGYFDALNLRHLDQGLKNLNQNTGFAARMQIVSENPRVIIDVSHNADGLLKTLKNVNNEDLFVVYGTSKDKDLSSVIPNLPSSARYFFTEFSNERSMSIENLQKLVKSSGLNSTFFKSVKSAYESANDCASKQSTILVIGSFFLIHDFLKIFSE